MNSAIPILSISALLFIHCGDRVLNPVLVDSISLSECIKSGKGDSSRFLLSGMWIPEDEYESMNSKLSDTDSVRHVPYEQSETYYGRNYYEIRQIGRLVFVISFNETIHDSVLFSDGSRSVNIFCLKDDLLIPIDTEMSKSNPRKPSHYVFGKLDVSGDERNLTFVIDRSKDDNANVDEMRSAVSITQIAPPAAILEDIENKMNDIESDKKKIIVDNIGGLLTLESCLSSHYTKRYDPSSMVIDDRRYSNELIPVEFFTFGNVVVALRPIPVPEAGLTRRMGMFCRTEDGLERIYEPYRFIGDPYLLCYSFPMIAEKLTQAGEGEHLCLSEWRQFGANESCRHMEIILSVGECKGACDEYRVECDYCKRSMCMDCSKACVFVADEGSCDNENGAYILWTESELRECQYTRSWLEHEMHKMSAKVKICICRHEGPYDIYGITGNEDHGQCLCE